jgi:hypothetical protein
VKGEGKRGKKGWVWILKVNVLGKRLNMYLGRELREQDKGIV